MYEELSYLNFDLLVERTSDGYRVRVLEGPNGQSPWVAFRLPFTDLEVEDFLVKLSRQRRIGGGGTTEITQAIRTFGGQLYQNLFGHDLQTHLLVSLERANNQGARLRIRLRISGAPELTDLPWEYLYDPVRDRFLCLSESSPLVRYPELPEPVRSLPVAGPLRLLVLVANPSDVNADQLDVEGEWTNLTGALANLEAKGRVRIDRLIPPTLSEMQQQLRRNHYHILHFIGHGRFDPQDNDGQLLLEDQHGRGRAASGRDLGILLYNHRQLRLAVLNACEGARSGRTDPFAGIAQSLIRQGIPAVVAMQFEISDVAASTFSKVLYEAIIDGYPVDAATTQARLAIYAQPNPVEWATPVLYMRAPDGRIFDVNPPIATAPSPVTTKPATLPAAGESAEDAVTTRQYPQQAGTEPTGPYATEQRVTEASAERAGQTPSSCSPAAPASPELGSSPLKLLQGTNPGSPVNAISWDPDGRRIVIAKNDATLSICTISGQKPTGTLVIKDQGRMLRSKTSVLDVAFSRDGNLLTTASRYRSSDVLTNRTREEGAARIWSAATGQEVVRALRHHDAVTTVAFSPDGNLLATTSGDNYARIWNVATGQELGWVRHDDTVTTVAFSPDGNLLATGSADSSARIWEAVGREQQLIVTHDDTVTTVAFSRDGSLLATGSADSSARIWNVATGEEVRKVRHDDAVTTVAFSPDGDLLATGSADNYARIWSVATGQELGWVRHDDTVTTVAFSSDGNLLATGSADSSARIWDLAGLQRALDNKVVLGTASARR